MLTSGKIRRANGATFKGKRSGGRRGFGKLGIPIACYECGKIAVLTNRICLNCYKRELYHNEPEYRKHELERGRIWREKNGKRKKKSMAHILPR